MSILHATAPLARTNEPRKRFRIDDIQILDLGRYTAVGVACITPLAYTL